MRQTLLQSSFNPTTALVFRLEQLPTWGFGPLLDITAARPLVRGLPSPRYVPSSGVHSLSTVFSAQRLAGLFHPAAELRTTSRAGASHSVQPSFLIGRRCLHAVGTRFAHPQAGCREPSSSTSRLCSVRSRVPSVRELASPTVAPLIGILCSSRCSSRRELAFLELLRSWRFDEPFVTVQARPRKTRRAPSALWRREARSFRLRHDRPARAFEPSAAREPNERSACRQATRPPSARSFPRGSADPKATGDPEIQNGHRSPSNPALQPRAPKGRHRITGSSVERGLGQRSRWCQPSSRPPRRATGWSNRTNEALTERSPLSPLPHLAAQAAEPHPPPMNPKAHEKRAGLASGQASGPNRARPLPRKGSAGLGSSRRRLALGSVAETEIETSRSTSIHLG